MDDLSQRLADTIKKAGMSPRNLGGATGIHFVTIYRAMNGQGVRQPLHEQTLTNALDKLDKLIFDGLLPVKDEMTRTQKTTYLTHLFDTHF